jgi:hypothetical protein
METLKSTIANVKSLTTDCKIRLFYNGREMKDDKTLGNYGYR